MRKDVLTEGEIYHIFTRSIADYVIFNRDSDFQRMLQLVKYYRTDNDLRLSYFIKQEFVQSKGFHNALYFISKDQEELVQVVAYCLMPTHLHLVLKQLSKNGISVYMNNILNGYTRYFNTLHKRKGPLWESRFKSVLIVSDEQLSHLVRYLHLNPTTAQLVKKPEDWEFSSYREYLGEVNDIRTICQFSDILDINPASYRKFVNDQISYQKELDEIKRLLLD